MNILAHLYIWPQHDHIQLGNVIGDFVKGNQFLKYPDPIAKGILLHRQIDTAADQHPQHKLVRELFRPHYQLYSGIVTDIVFDYVLAVNWEKYHPQPLAHFAQATYNHLQQNQIHIPPTMQRYVNSMITNNWLVSYGTLIGIETILNGMAKHTSLPNKTPNALEIISKNYQKIEAAFEQLMPELCNLARSL